MIRGMKKKLLIGLLTAAVVGSSLAPSVPYSEEFTQEVKADTPSAVTTRKAVTVQVNKTQAYKWGDNGTDGATLYKKVNNDYIKGAGAATEGATAYEINSPTVVSAQAVEEGGSVSNYKWGDNGTDGTTLYKKVGNDYIKGAGTATEGATAYEINDPTSVLATKDGESTITTSLQFSAGKYYETADSSSALTEKQWNQKVTGAVQSEASGSFTVYEKDTTKAVVEVTPSKDTKSTFSNTKIGSTLGTSAVIDKNKATEVTGDVIASDSAKTIKSVVAKIINTTTNQQIGTDITATKVDGTDNTYKFAFQTAEDSIRIVISTVEEDLMITPKLTDTLASNVGTAALTSTSAVKVGKEFELKVTLAEGAKAKDVIVKANDTALTGTEEDGVVTYKIPTAGLKDKELEIFVSGHRDNDGLDKEVSKNGSKATVENTSDVSVDANSVLEAVKEGETGYVNALIEVSADNSVDTDALAKEVSARTTVDTKLKLAGCININVYKTTSEVADGAPAITKEAANEVTLLQKPVVVNYFLPSEALNKSGYKVLRYHDTIDEITTTPNADGEYIEVSGGKLTLHVKKLSEFAVLYNDEAGTTPEVNPTDPTDPTNPTDPTTPDAGNTNNGAVTPANPAAAAGATTATKADEAKKAPAAPAPAKKLSAKTGSPKTADYAVNSLLALLTGAAGLFGISLMNSKKRKDEDQ